jgi:hypothetical protein
MHHLFLDESGDHSLTHIDCGYPVFVLGGILVGDDLGLATLERSVTAFKYDFFGDPGVVLSGATSIAASTRCSRRSSSAWSHASSASGLSSSGTANSP